MASYPGTKRTFTTRVDVTDVVFASHMNDTQDEIRAIQDTVGINPHVSTAGGGSSLGAWSGAVRTYQTLNDRLANIEAGLVADTHTQYARLANTETFTGTKTFSAAQTFFGAATGTTSAQVFLSSGTTGGEASLFWRDGTTSRWALYRVAGGNELHLRDMVNARHQVSFAPGASNTAASTLFGSNVTVAGNTTLQGTTSTAALTMSGALTLAAGTGATPSTSAVGQAAAGGTATTVARADHVHGREAFGATVAQTSYSLAAADGASTSLARADHTHGTPPPPTPTQVGALALTGGTLTGTLHATPPAGPGSLAVGLNHSYGLYVDNTGPGSAASRVWLNGPDGGALYLGPRAGASYFAYIELRGRTLDLTGGRTLLKAYRETVLALPAVAAAGTVTLDIAAATMFNYDGSAGGHTVAFANHATGDFWLLRVYMSAVQAITWPTGLKWQNGAAPTLAVGDNVFTFWVDNGGVVYGTYGGKFA